MKVFGKVVPNVIVIGGDVSENRDPCSHPGCNKVATIGGTGIRDRQVYHEDFCDEHYYGRKFINSDGAKAARQERKLQKRLEKSKAQAPTAPVDYAEFEKYGYRVEFRNQGKQVVLTNKGVPKGPSSITVDYWPSSQKFWVRETGVRGQGRDSLMEVIVQN